MPNTARIGPCFGLWWTVMAGIGGGTARVGWAGRGQSGRLWALVALPVV